jgi:hypothetical protein
MANEKFSALLGCQITGFLWLSRLYERGVGHRQERWGGMRWTRQRRRVLFARGRAMLVRTAKSCGPDAPMLASSWRGYSQATVARKPVTGESTK